MRTKVLVIDDDSVLLEVVRERLEAIDCEVFVRQEALGTTQAVRAHRPDIVLLDVMMPALSGERVIGLLQGSRAMAGVGVILYSSKPEAELLELVESTGALGAISKALGAAEFTRRFDALVRLHRGSRS
jgi:DNA-binding response OmpR family regulator